MEMGLNERTSTVVMHGMDRPCLIAPLTDSMMLLAKSGT
jgi:hypothetical protein